MEFLSLNDILCIYDNVIITSICICRQGKTEKSRSKNEVRAYKKTPGHIIGPERLRCIIICVKQVIFSYTPAM